MTCCVCLEDLSGSEVAVLPCQHTIHATCFVTYASYNNEANDVCPMCRRRWWSFSDCCANDVCVAAEKNHTSCFCRLVDSKSSVDAFGETLRRQRMTISLTPDKIYKCIQSILLYDNLESLKALCSIVGPTYFILHNKFPSVILDRRATALTVACKHNAAHCLKWMLKHIKYSTYACSHALAMACANAHFEVAETLVLNKNIDYTFCDFEGNDILYHTGISGSYECYKLIKRNNSISEQSITKLLSCIIANSQNAFFFKRILQTYNVHNIDNLLLNTMWRWKNKHIIDCLLKKGASVNYKCTQLNVSVMDATVSFIPSSFWVRYFLKRGARVSKSCVLRACKQTNFVTLSVILGAFRKQNPFKQISDVKFTNLVTAHTTTEQAAIILNSQIFDFSSSRIELALMDPYLYTDDVCRFLLHNRVLSTQIDFELMKSMCNYLSMRSCILKELALRFDNIAPCRGVSLSVTETLHLIGKRASLSLVETLMFKSSLTNESELINLVTDQTSLKNIRFSNNSTFLHESVRRNMIHLTLMLLKLNADPNVVDATGKTPICYANRPDVFQTLLLHGASVTQSYNNETPLCAILRLNSEDNMREITSSMNTALLKEATNREIDGICWFLVGILRCEYNALLEDLFVRNVFSMKLLHKNTLAMMLAMTNSIQLVKLLHLGIPLKRLDLQLTLRFVTTLKTQHVFRNTLLSIQKRGYDAKKTLESLSVSFILECFADDTSLLQIFNVRFPEAVLQKALQDPKYLFIVDYIHTKTPTTLSLQAQTYLKAHQTHCFPKLEHSVNNVMYHNHD